jgi:hypothetical protein
MKATSVRLLYFLVSIGVISCVSAPNETTSVDQEVHRVLTIYGEEISYSGGQGQSCSDAVVILGASNDVVCVEAQYEWIRAEFEDSHPVMHESILPEDGRMLSQISIETPNGNRNVCFDISECESIF